MQHFFVINPNAGKGKQIEELKAKIIETAEKLGISYEIHMTEAPAEATSFIKRKLSEITDDICRFYACGGDGTLGEVANGVGETENAEIALIPMGTGNDFRRNFDHKENFFDIEKQIHGTPHKIDLISYNGKYCINMINIGFDCNVVKRTETIKKNRFIPSKMAYIFGLVSTLFKKLTTPMKIETDSGYSKEAPLLLTVIANGQFCGGGFDAAPKAKLNDGKLDLCVINKIGRIKFIKLVSSYKKGTHLESKFAQKHHIVDYSQGTEIKYTFSSPTDICVDGEVETVSELNIGIIHDAAVFSVPDGSHIIPQSDFFNEEELSIKNEILS